MLRTSNFLGAAAVVLGLAVAGSADASQYVPNRDADAFRYKNNRYGTETDVRISQTSNGWKLYNQFAGLGQRWIWTAPSHEYVYIWNGSSYELIANFDGPVGSRSPITIGCNRGTVTLAEKGLSLTTPAGTFTNVIRLDLTTSCADAGVESIWFAKGIGVVKWGEQNIAGYIETELIAGTIGGTTYPAPVGSQSALQVTSTISELTPTINQLPPLPRPAKKVRASLTVKNTSGADMHFTFNSGQSFDILVIDQNDQVVSAWSRGRFFTQALRGLTLKANDSWTFADEVELTDDSGRALDPGTYKLVMELKAYPRVSVAYDIEVSVAR